MSARVPLARRVIAALFLVLLNACYSWRTATISPAQLIAEQEPSIVRVTLTDGMQLTLRDPSIRNDSLVHENGRAHENMHLVLKRRTTRPPRSNMRTQQRAFREFRRHYNEIRPHEALEGAVPADLYRPSPRPFPKQLEAVTYPGHFETRLVSTNGGIRWYADRVPVGRLFAGHEVG